MLFEGFQAFVGPTNVIEWGKKRLRRPARTAASPASSTTASTRAENDPRYAAAEPWEPGIPRVQVNLYQDTNGDGIIDDLNGDGGVTAGRRGQLPVRQLVPGRWAEDVDRNGNGSRSNRPGDAIEVATHRQLGRQPAHRLRRATSSTSMAWPRTASTACATSTRSARRSSTAATPSARLPARIDRRRACRPAPTSSRRWRRPGYETGQGRGQERRLRRQLHPRPPTSHRRPCVGDLHLVPQYLTLFPGADPGALRRPDRARCATASRSRSTTARTRRPTSSCSPRCPIAGHIAGFILDDLATSSTRTRRTSARSTRRRCCRSRSATGRAARSAAPTPTSTASTTPWCRRPTPPTCPCRAASRPNMLTVCMNDPGRSWTPGRLPDLRPDDRPTRTSTGSTASSAYTLQYMPGRRRTSTRRSSRCGLRGRQPVPARLRVPGRHAEIYSVSSGVPRAAARTSVATGTGSITIAAEGNGGGAEPRVRRRRRRPAQDRSSATTASAPPPGTVTINGMALTGRESGAPAPSPAPWPPVPPPASWS